ncbi:Golgi integral membrane protein 4-like isoform X2 [Xyrauchen texanus]|uniref:Golgi integral membrane protein 4-like isoform X2 n=1 Tax=Xyrauchen texanus TaxID=154827 RepID=UPI002242A260|nr:Golgi integral membrane protein 4-like isoform X2 [Xyrauchen texanus]
MGKGICSRRQRTIFQSFLLLIFVCGTICAFMISYEMHKELKKTEATALKYQQHQESLSAQLQVVYEHHSKLEKSLHKERLEHKKAEEDFLLFKRESQKALNKEKQESNYRLNSLQTEHQILKAQHEDLRMEYYELQEKHQNQGEDHEHVLDEHKQEMDHMQREKEADISRLKENVYNLQEENRQLRKAHQDIYTQLLDELHKNLKASKDDLTLTLEDHKNALVAAQLQVEELRQLKGNHYKASNAVQAAKIDTLPTATTHSHELEAVEHRKRIQELDFKPNVVEGYQGKENVLPPHGVLDINETKVEMKQPPQIDVFAEGKGQKEERSTSKDGGGEDERKQAALEHSLSNLEEQSINLSNTLSQTLEKKTQTETLHRTKEHFEALDQVIAERNAVQLHHDLAGREGVKNIENTQKHDKNGLFEKSLGVRDLNSEIEANNLKKEDEVAEEETEDKPNMNKDRPEEDEQIVVKHQDEVAGNPEQQEEQPDEQYEDELENGTFDDSVHDREKSTEKEENEEDPYSENNGAEDLA